MVVLRRKCRGIGKDDAHRPYTSAALELLLRSWNVFHGNANPPERRTFLEQMVRLAVADRPTAVFLQEVPAWALGKLGGWSGMATVAEVAAHPTLGPFPSTAALGRALTALHPGRLRSAFAGQGNALLLGQGARVVARSCLTLNTRAFRRAQAQWLDLPSVARWTWAKERRICQAVRAILPDGRAALLANLHATGYRPDKRLPDAELLRAAVFADALAEPGDVCVLAGDFNVTADHSTTMKDLASAQWGFSRAGEGIDHILVRGAEVSTPEPWPRDRRLVDGRILSDHAPVDLVLR